VARAKVLANPGVDALRHWQAQPDDPALLTQPLPLQAGALYAACLASSRLRDAALAQRLQQRLQTLLAADAPAQQQARWLGMEVALAAHNPARAQALVAATPSQLTTPLARPALLLQAQIALQAADATALAQSAQDLQQRVAQEPRDALAWQWLSSVYAAQNQPLRVLRAQAEVRVAQLDYAGALDRLRAAQEYTAAAGEASVSHIDRSIIDTRRRQVEALFKEQALDH